MTISKEKPAALKHLDSAPSQDDGLEQVPTLKQVESAPSDDGSEQVPPVAPTDSDKVRSELEEDVVEDPLWVEMRGEQAAFQAQQDEMAKRNIEGGQRRADQRSAIYQRQCPQPEGTDTRAAALFGGHQLALTNAHPAAQNPAGIVAPTNTGAWNLSLLDNQTSLEDLARSIPVQEAEAMLGNQPLNAQVVLLGAASLMRGNGPAFQRVRVRSPLPELKQPSIPFLDAAENAVETPTGLPDARSSPEKNAGEHSPAKGGRTKRPWEDFKETQETPPVSPARKHRLPFLGSEFSKVLPPSSGHFQAFLEGRQDDEGNPLSPADEATSGKKP